MGDFGADQAAHLHHQQMIGRPRTGCRHLQPTRRLGPRGYISQIADAGTRIGDPNSRVADHQGDMGEILHRIIAHLLPVNGRADRMARDIGHHQRIAIGRSTGDRFAANRGAGASAVFHHHRNAKLFLQARANQSRDKIRCPTRGKGHDQANGLIGPGGLRVGRPPCQRQGANTQHHAPACNDPQFHLPVLVRFYGMGPQTRQARPNPRLASPQPCANHHAKLMKDKPHAARRSPAQ